jgi:dihydrofolate reductase
MSEGGPAEVLAEIDAAGLGRVWLVGGGTLAGSFRMHQLIDECLITVIPIVLGSGVPLFTDDGPVSRLSLVSTRTFAGGAVGLHYERAADS